MPTPSRRPRKAKTVKPTGSLLTSQPVELIAALRTQVRRLKTQADQIGIPAPTISQFVGEAIAAKLDSDLVGEIPNRMRRGRIPTAKAVFKQSE